MKSKTSSKVIEDLRAFRQNAESYWSKIYALAKEDLRFATVKGAQWDKAVLEARKQEGLPSMEINKLSVFIQQIVNNQRMNRESIRVLPVGDTDVKAAQVREAIVKHIVTNSEAEEASDMAFEQAVGGGFGFFRVCTNYIDDDENNPQDISFKRITNQFAVLIDPNSTKADGSDAQKACILSKISKAAFKTQYPNASPLEQPDDDWCNSDTVTVVEFFRVESKKTVTYTLEDGGIVDKESYTAGNIIKTNETKKKIIKHYICNGQEVLEETVFPGKYIPIVLVCGMERWIENERHLISLIRHAKDPAKLYNYARTTEMMQLREAVNTPIVAAEGQLEGYENDWQESHNPRVKVLHYKQRDVDGSAAPPPSRLAPYMGSPELLKQAMTASEEIKATTGIFDPSLGNQSNETSGRAIIARQNQGQQANFHFNDNLWRSKRHACMIVLSMIPEVYDTERVLRICKPDKTYKEIQMNGVPNPMEAQNQDAEYVSIVNGVLNDMTYGKYDVVVEAGKDYKTIRQQTYESLVLLAQTNPQIMQVAGDLIAKSFDSEYSEEISERLKRAIPPNLLQADQNSKEAQIQQQMQQQMQQMQEQFTQQISQLEQALADKQAQREHELLLEELRIKGRLEERAIEQNGKADVAELNGLVKMLANGIQPPAQLTQEVNKDFVEDYGAENEYIDNNQNQEYADGYEQPPEQEGQEPIDEELLQSIIAEEVRKMTEHQPPQEGEQLAVEGEPDANQGFNS